MLNIAIILFAVAAVLGLTILVKWMTKKDAPKAVIYSHGLVAAAGLALLVYYAFANPDNFPKVSLLLFLIAAVAGFYMFFQDLVKKAHPVVFGFVHALVAVCGVVALLIFVLE